MRNKVTQIYRTLNGYKVISKALELQRNQVRAAIHRQKNPGAVENLPRSGRITLSAYQRRIKEVAKKPRKTSKALLTSPASVKSEFMIEQ